MSRDFAIWCKQDLHIEYERFEDFNDWLCSDDAEDLRASLGVDGISEPSKALFAGDRVSYDQFLEQYRTDRWHEALNQVFTDKLSEILYQMSIRTVFST